MPAHVITGERIEAYRLSMLVMYCEREANPNGLRLTSRGPKLRQINAEFGTKWRTWDQAAKGLKALRDAEDRELDIPARGER